MRILHVVPSIAPDRGGPARSVRSLVAALRRAGCEVELAAAGGEVAEAIPIEHLPGPFEVPTPAARRRLGAAVDRADVVEIHSLWNGTSTLAASLCRGRRTPYVLCPRGMLDPTCLERHRLRKRVYALAVEGRTVAGAGGFHFLSEDERERAVVERRPPAELCVVSPNGAPDLPPGLDRVGPGDRPVVLHLGRLDAIKGIELQLEALARLPAARRPLLSLVGPDHGDGPRLRQLASRLGVAGDVEWKGPVYGDERFRLLASADLVLSTSIYDCNPVVATEAMAVGAAVLATDRSGLGGYGRAGAVAVVPRTVEALASALDELLSDPDRRTGLRRRARELAASDLPWSRVIVPLVDLYGRLASRNRRGEPVP